MKKKFRCDKAFVYLLQLKQALSKDDVEYPVSAIIHGSRNAKRIETELEEYIRIREEKIEKFGKKNADGLKTIQMKELQDLMKEYDKIEIEVEIIMVSMGDFTKFSYRPTDLMPFEFMIKEED